MCATVLVGSVWRVGAYDSPFGQQLAQCSGDLRGVAAQYVGEVSWSTRLGQKRENAFAYATSFLLKAVADLRSESAGSGPIEPTIGIVEIADRICSQLPDVGELAHGAGNPVQAVALYGDCADVFALGDSVARIA